MNQPGEIDDTPANLVGAVMPVHDAGKQVAAAYQVGLNDGRRQAWDEAAQALAWAIENGPVEGAAAYVAANNPYRSDARTRPANPTQPTTPGEPT